MRTHILISATHVEHNILYYHYTIIMRVMHTSRAHYMDTVDLEIRRKKGNNSGRIPEKNK